MGLDLDTYITGYAFLSLAEPVRILDYGKILSSKEDVLDRWRSIARDVIEVCPAGGLVKAVAIEEPNCFSNGETTRQLCGLFGIVSYVLYQNGYYPTAVNTAHAKKIFCGKGGGDKSVTVDRVNALFNLNFRFSAKAKAKRRDAKSLITSAGMSDDDVADAIAVAWTLRKDLIETKGSGFEDLSKIPLTNEQV